jgi:hypothetical protein
MPQAAAFSLLGERRLAMAAAVRDLPQRGCNNLAGPLHIFDAHSFFDRFRDTVRKKQVSIIFVLQQQQRRRLQTKTKDVFIQAELPV